MFDVFPHSNVLGKEDQPSATPCEARTYRGTKAPALTAQTEESDKSGLCGQGRKYFLSIAIKLFIWGSVAKGQGGFL